MLTSSLSKFAVTIAIRSMHRELAKGVCVCLGEAQGTLGVPMGQLRGSVGEMSQTTGGQAS